MMIVNKSQPGTVRDQKGMEGVEFALNSANEKFISM